MMQKGGRALLYSAGILLLACVLLCHCSTYLNGQEEILSENGKVESYLVSKNRDIYVATSNAILQFQNYSISLNNEQSVFDVIGNTSVFTLFMYMRSEYLLWCNFTACFIHNSSDISQFWQVQTWGDKAGDSLGGEHSAQVVFIPCDEEYCNLFSAISSVRDVETFSERSYDLYEDTFSIYHRSDDVEKQYIRSKPGTKFEFIFSFYSDRFVYFLRNTLTHDGERTAYISQTCHGKSHSYFRSYMESRLECNGYTTLIAATLVKAQTGNILVASFRGSQTKFAGSIVCKFPLNMVESYFADEQRACFEGQRGSWPDWIDPPGESCSQKLDIVDFSCGHTDHNRRIHFDDSLKNTNSHDSVLLSNQREMITSVLIIPHRDIFVGYLGTGAGHLQKILFNSSWKAVTVFQASVSKEQGPVRSLVPSGDGSKLFYIQSTKTTSRLFMLSTRECAVHSECYGCLSDLLQCVWIQGTQNGVYSPTGKCLSRDTLGQKPPSYFNAFCPPQVHDIQPRKGPTTGGTILQITGLMDNIYHKTSDQNGGVKVTVDIGNTSCRISDTTQFPERLECITASIETAGAFPVLLKMHNNVNNTAADGFQPKLSYGIANYKPQFVYVDPELLDSEVSITVKLSGNIQITIQGENLNIGSRKRVTIGQTDCPITRITENEILCRAPKQNDTENFTLMYEVDNFKVNGSVVSYIPEPVIQDIQPRSSIASGGLTLTISGENLDGFGLQSQLYLQDHNQTSTGQIADSMDRCSLIWILRTGWKHTMYIFSSHSLNCFLCNFSLCEIADVSSDKILLCKTAATENLDHLPFWTTPSLFNVYGKMKTIEHLKVLIVEDPVMEQNNKIIALLENINHVEIKFKGTPLKNISKDDIRITVGISECYVNEVLEDGILCIMFNLKSATESLKERVTCKIGYRTYYLGTVAFQGPKEQLKEPSPETINASYNTVFAAVAVIFGLVVVVFVMFGIKKLKSKRRHQSRDELYNVRYRRNSNILTLDGLSESHTSDVVQNRQNDYQENRFLRTAQENTFAKETEPLLPVLDENTRALFAQKNLIIANECLILGEIIGQGHFGCVYKGYLTIPNEKAERIVACKTLHRNDPKDLDIDMFLKEALLMKDFHHNHVMELIGICLGIDKLPLVILPFMKKGDVLSYIRDVDNKPTVKDLVLFGVDIANGMHYLSQLKFVHRDLAARNCMIDDDMKVKVADFGLSRDVYEKEYYSSCDKKAKLPVKWMSPESLEFGIFTHKSDVWSFGVVLWELLTRGVNPYPTVDNWDILRYLREGRRLNKPDFCPEEMFRIMQHCWCWKADDRPTFGDLTIKVPELLRKLERASEKRKQLETSY